MNGRRCRYLSVPFKEVTLYTGSESLKKGNKRAGIVAAAVLIRQLVASSQSLRYEGCRVRTLWETLLWAALKFKYAGTFENCINKPSLLQRAQTFVRVKSNAVSRALRLVLGTLLHREN